MSPIASRVLGADLFQGGSSPGNIRKTSFDNEESKDEYAGSKNIRSGKSKISNLMKSVMETHSNG